VKRGWRRAKLCVSFHNRTASAVRQPRTQNEPKTNSKFAQQTARSGRKMPDGAHVALQGLRQPGMARVELKAEH